MIIIIEKWFFEEGQREERTLGYDMAPVHSLRTLQRCISFYIFKIGMSERNKRIVAISVVLVLTGIGLIGLGIWVLERWGPSFPFQLLEPNSFFLLTF